MAKIKKIVTSEVEGSTYGPGFEKNSYTFNTEGGIAYHGENKTQPLIKPGVVYGSGADSGDGQGLDTIKLIPNAPGANVSDDRYLIIDPTQPNHIHIRAGGQQDASNAELIFGGEKAHVKVTDYNHGVRIQSWDSANDKIKGWDFTSDGTLQGPGDSGNLKVYGIKNADSTNYLEMISSGSLKLEATGGDMNLYMDGAAYIGPSSTENRIAQVKDLNSYINSVFATVQWTPNFSATGLSFTGTGNTHPTSQSYYVKQGQLVSFWIAVDCSTVTSFGTGQIMLELPIDPLPGSMNHFSGWVFVDSTANPDLAGHIIVNADHLPNTKTIDLHYIKSAGGANSPVMEAQLKQGEPLVLTTNTKIYVNGTYIAAP